MYLKINLVRIFDPITKKEYFIELALKIRILKADLVRSSLFKKNVLNLAFLDFKKFLKKRGEVISLPINQRHKLFDETKLKSNSNSFTVLVRDWLFYFLINSKHC
jgi:hypothetical protein